MRRLPPATPEERELIESCLRHLRDAIARRETLAPGEAIDLGGVPYTRETLERMSRVSPDLLRREAREALAWKRQILFEEGSD